MKEKKIARDTRNREKLAGDDWVMAEFYATWCPPFHLFLELFYQRLHTLAVRTPRCIKFCH